jgi:hypothetical protein
MVGGVCGVVYVEGDLELFPRIIESRDACAASGFARLRKRFEAQQF